MRLVSLAAAPILLLTAAGYFLAAPAILQAEIESATAAYAELVLSDKPVAWWKLGQVEEGVVKNLAPGDDASALNGKLVGQVKFGGDQTGSATPSFNDSDRAASPNEKGGHISVADPGANSPLDFDKNDSITLEAWVNPQQLRDGQHIYIVGKGRTNNAGFPRENQNYALRLTGKGTSAAVSFLFRNSDNRSGESKDYHRWTSNAGFPLGSGWHHIAVTYTFGKKDSVRGYIDGYRLNGTWDMGGATDKAPVVDNDELWIGSALGGNGGNTFQGQIGEVAIYRTALPAERLRLRYRTIVPETPEEETVRRELPPGRVVVDILEGVADQKTWDFPPFSPPKVTDTYEQGTFAFVDVPKKYSAKAIQTDRSNPFLVRAEGMVVLPPGEHRLLLRSRSGGRLFIDGKLVLETKFFNISSSAHGTVRHWDVVKDEGIRPLSVGNNEAVTTITGDGQPHRVRMELFIGGAKLRPEFGETCAAIAVGDRPFQLLAPSGDYPLTDDGWLAWEDQTRAELSRLDAERRRTLGAKETEFWNSRHEIARREVEKTPAPAVPEAVEGFPAHNEIDRFLASKRDQFDAKPTPLVDDWTFLRRTTLDLIGTVPTREQIDAFVNDTRPDRRARYIDSLLEHPGWADHWVGYWQDVLAENPNIVNPTLNNTGPFRWWIHESFLDNKPMDRFVTELMMMEGSEYFGGPAGFAMATQNDAPMVAKAHIIGQAFLGVDMKCARCHDAPFHDILQQDLFALGAMLKRSPQPVPKSSTIPLDPEALKSLIVQVTLKPGTNVAPEWPFHELATPELPDGMLRSSGDSRELAAALITSPHNERFAKVIVNRLWKRYMGLGLVEPVDDWENAEPVHAELLTWLAREFVTHGYDLKHVARLILNSHTYQRVANPVPPVDPLAPYHFASPLRRRMTAEQIVDSIFLACGKDLNAGEMVIDADGARPYTSSLNLGRAQRAWHFTSPSNERDRPSLALPLAQDFVSLMETFGWRSSRQDPLTVRDSTMTVLQPAILNNGVVGRRFTRLSDDSAFTAMALEDQPLEALIDRVFLRTLTRKPTSDERAQFVELLQDGYADRRVDVDPSEIKIRRLRNPGVSWSNHLSPEANELVVELAKQVQAGDPPTKRLKPDWRERFEDMLWAVLNTPEFVFVP